ncbi:MAG: aspartate kinase [Bacillota bacterium]|nr:MAG: aspartate kinase [Bacillota bacterium]
MNIVVQKYGGTSVGTTEKIKRVADKIIQKKNDGYAVVVVVSAMGKATDHLIAMAKEVSKNPDSREMDMLLTTGEQVSIALLAMALIDKGYPAVSYTGHQLRITTSSAHQHARIIDIDPARVDRALREDKIVVVAGFQGVTEEQAYTTLGRGGSDTSAVALAAKLKASCEIYTDVEGIYTMDPRKLKNARKLQSISYEEMMEMASLGAGVMHYRAVELAGNYSLPLYVASTFADTQGTMIEGASKLMEQTVITGMASSLDDVQITVRHLPADASTLYRLFGELAQEEINVDMISQMITDAGEMHVSCTIPKETKELAQRIMTRWQVENPQIRWELNLDIAKVSVVGLGMRTHSGIAARVFKAMADNDIEIRMVTTSEIRISWVVDARHEDKVVLLIGQAFGLTT